MMDAKWREITKYFFEHASWKGRRYRGVPIGKNPLDLFTYGELIEKVQPALIVEFGTWWGGSALWFADHMELQGGKPGNVITVDRNIRHQQQWPKDDRITYIVGGSCELAVYTQIQKAVLNANGPVLFSADSSHRYNHVLQELDLYAPLVPANSYYVCEDGVLDHVMKWRTAGAHKAITDFLEKHPEWEADKSCEAYGITHHPSGYLRRKP